MKKLFYATCLFLSFAACKNDKNNWISADKDVPHGRVVSVLDIVKSAGVKKFAISIDKK